MKSRLVRMEDRKLGERDGVVGRGEDLVGIPLRVLWFGGIVGLLALQLFRTGGYMLDIRSVLSGEAQAVVPSTHMAGERGSLKFVGVTEIVDADTIDLAAQDAIVLVFLISTSKCNRRYQGA